MSSKILLSFLGGCLALLLVMGITNNKADAQVVSGVTEEPSGQIIVPFDERAFDGVFRDTHFQLTNTSREAGVTLHIQLLYSGDDNCTELDFFDTFTPEDTHVYDLDGDLTRNDGGGYPGFDGTNRSEYGIVVVTPVVGADSPVPIAFNNLHAVVTMQTASEQTGRATVYRFNAYGRDAVNLATGAKSAEGTLLDGVAAGFQRVIPNDMIYHYTEAPFNGFPVWADLMFFAIKDDYFGGDNYKAVGGTTSLFSIEHVVDNAENSLSCGDVQFSCLEIYGINTNIISQLDALGATEDPIICDITNYDEGFDQLAARAGEDADAIFGVIGLASSNAAGATHMFVE